LDRTTIAALAADEGESMSNLHTELYPALADVTTKIHEADVELGKSLAHFATEVSPKLSGEERAQLATILHRAYAMQPVADTEDRPKHQMAPTNGIETIDDSLVSQSPLGTL
jgi:hypothetical protein